MKDKTKIDRATLLKVGGAAGAALLVESLLSTAMAEAKTPFTGPMSLGITLTSTSKAKKPAKKRGGRTATSCTLSGSTVWIGLADSDRSLPTPPSSNYTVIFDGTHNFDVKGTDWHDNGIGKASQNVKVLIINY